MTYGVKTSDLANASALDELIGNTSGNTRRVGVPAFTAQLVGSDLFRQAIGSNMLSPQNFGAVGDGVTNDSSALVAWAAACQAEGRQPYVPPGVYLCSAQLNFSSKGAAILGAGENLSIIRFTNLAAGFKCHPTTNPYGAFSLDRIGLQASTVVLKAVDVVLPDDGDFTNNFRTGYRNVELLGVGSDGYFVTGIRERNVAFSERRRVKYWGQWQNPTAIGGYYTGIGFDLDTQVIGDDPANGLSLENIFDGCSVAFASTAVRVRGFPEGLYFKSNNFAFVRKGIDAVAEDGTRQPLVNVIGNHINAIDTCILLDRFNQSHVIGNHLARPNGLWTSTWVGIDLDDSLNAVVSSNVIVPEIVSIPAGATYGIRLAGDSFYTVISANQFVGAISADFKPLTAAIRLESGVQGAKIDGSNQYTGLITTPLSNVSGNTTNEFYNSVIPGITVQKNGVTQGTAGAIRLLNFNGDFNISVTGNSASIDVV